MSGFHSTKRLLARSWQRTHPRLARYRTIFLFLGSLLFALVFAYYIRFSPSSIGTLLLKLLNVPAGDEPNLLLNLKSEFVGIVVTVAIVTPLTSFLVQFLERRKEGKQKALLATYLEKEINSLRQGAAAVADAFCQDLIVAHALVLNFPPWKHRNFPSTERVSSGCRTLGEQLGRLELILSYFQGHFDVFEAIAAANFVRQTHEISELVERLRKLMESWDKTFLPLMAHCRDNEESRDTVRAMSSFLDETLRSHGTTIDIRVKGYRYWAESSFDHSRLDAALFLLTQKAFGWTSNVDVNPFSDRSLYESYTWFMYLGFYDAAGILNRSIHGTLTTLLEAIRG